MDRKDVNAFVEFFTNEDPARIIEAMNLVNQAMDKNIEELELAIKLARNPKIKKIFKDILKLKIDNL